MTSADSQPSPWEVVGVTEYHFTTQGRSLRELMNNLRDGTIDASPPYQRGLVWDEPRQVALIDSLWRGLGMPGLYFRQFKNSSPSGAHWEVLDGQQRLHAIRCYVDGGFAFNGKLFTDLPVYVQRVFLFMAATVSIAKDLTDEDALVIYDRINFCGVPHTAAERKPIERSTP